MKRKVIGAILCVTLVFSSTTLVFADKKDDKIKALETKVEQMQKTIDELTKRLEKYEANADIESYLLEKGVLTGERVEMAADMIGGISGFRYGDAQIYKFDIKSEEYKTLSDGGEVPVEGFDGITMGALAVNGEYVLVGEASDELLKAFKEYK